MAGERDDRSDLVEPHRPDRRQRIFLGLDQAFLERLESLVEGYRDRFCAECPKHRQQCRLVRDPDHQSFEILEISDWFLRCYVTFAVVGKPEDFQSGDFFKPSLQLFKQAAPTIGIPMSEIAK